MRKLFLAAAFILAAAVSCEVIDDGLTGGHQGTETSDDSPVCVFTFTDEQDNPLDVKRLVLISEVLENSPLIIEPDVPGGPAKAKISPTVNHFATYQFLVTTSDGKAFRATRDLYIPSDRRYEKTIALKPAWKIAEIKKGLKWYNYEGFEVVTLQKQVINVLEMDLDSKTMKLDILYYPVKEKISTVGKSSADILAVTNASFGSGYTNKPTVDNTYIRINGVNYKEISIGPDDTGNWWKHEAAMWYDGESQFGFINMAGDPAGAIEYYKSTTYKNLFSSNAMLVEDQEKSDLAAYSRKFTSSAREPRTVLAVTADRKLLLMTVDGRWSDKAAGMSYVELQDVLQTYFNPSYAINMDGGGSTGMYIKGRGRNSTDVVNYPCEGNSDYKVYGGTTKERPLITYFAIREK